MKKPVFSHAIDNALCATETQPQRSSGGFGVFPKTFVALKTSRRLIAMDFAVEVDLPHFKSRLELTAAGRAALARVKP
jgi:hypothetical protein